MSSSHADQLSRLTQVQINSHRHIKSLNVAGKEFGQNCCNAKETTAMQMLKDIFYIFTIFTYVRIYIFVMFQAFLPTIRKYLHSFQ